MNKKFTDFFEAWWYLCETPVFFLNREDAEKAGIPEFIRQHDTYFEKGLDINVVKVNPETDMVDDDESLNTKTEIWLECGEPYVGDGQIGKEGEVYCCHNIDYDCGGDTFEEAIINLANIVWEKNKK